MAASEPLPIFPGNWEHVNTFLGVGHNADGSLKGGGGVPAFLASTYGAKLDGVTDDSAKIQAAIDACSAAGGGVVLIDGITDIQGHGHTVIVNTTLRMKSGVWLRGLGAATDIRGVANPVIALPTSGSFLERTAVTDLSIGNCVGDAISFDESPFTGGMQLGWSRITIENVTVADAGGTAFVYALSGGLLETRFINCVSLRAAARGFQILATDNMMIGCTAAQSGSDGFYVGANTKLTGSKAYGNSGSGFVSEHGGRCSIAGCESQDNVGYGFKLDASNALAGCVSDTDGLGSVYISGVDNSVDIACLYGGGGSGQHTKTWVFFDTGASGNNVKLAGRFDFTDVAFVTGNVDGNSVQAGGWNARSQQAYTASFTPAPYQYGTAAMTLTGNVTIVAPKYHHVGQRLAFEFTQDSVGGRTVTWPAQFAATWTPTTTAGVVNRIEFEDTGTVWEQRSVNVGLASGAAGIADTFNRANGALGTSSSGATWTTVGTAPVVSSNTCVWGGALGYAFIDAGRVDVAVQADCVAQAGFGVSLIARYAGGTDFIHLDTNGLYQIVGGVAKQLIGATFNWAAGDTPKLVLSGGTVLVYKNGVLVGTARTDLLVGTQYGIKLTSATDTWDNFSIS